MRKNGLVQIQDKIKSPDFLIQVALGKIEGATYISKFGQNIALVDSALVYADIWDGGGTYSYPPDATAPITKIVARDLSDTELIEIQGLDINGDLVVQTKTLTGLTAVTLDTALWRVFRLKNIGTLDLVGNVSVINDADSIDYALINGANNQTLMALLTIPAGKTGFLLQGTASLVGSNKSYTVDGRMWTRSYGSVFQLKNTFGLNTEGSSNMKHTYPIPLKINEKTDLRVDASAAGAVGSLNATFDVLILDNVIWGL